MLACTNASKVIVVALGMCLLSDSASPLAVIGAALAICGNLVYLHSRLRTMQAHEGAKRDGKDGAAADDADLADLTTRIAPAFFASVSMATGLVAPPAKPHAEPPAAGASSGASDARSDMIDRISAP